ncbi:MAG: SGNH/GDSL hydrolase family protein [Planctomycetes bacterium]|nr:SGNH/GDSL hydrolase family protein [Planctomycetota bacterium]
MAEAQRLDRNMDARDVVDGVRWIPAGAACRLDGRAWSDAAPYARLPDRARALVRDEVWQLSRNAAGLSLSFTTDSPQLSVRWRLTGSELALPNMPATGVSGVDLYERVTDRWRWMSIGRWPTFPVSQAQLYSGLERRPRALRLYLPLYNSVDQVEIGIVPDASIAPAAIEPARPICCYGTSIVQGGCASRPGLAYPAILSRRLDLPVLNLGFSGNARMEPALAALLCELDPCAYLLDALPNMDAAMIDACFVPFVSALRAARPRTPIVLAGHLVTTNAWFDPASARRGSEIEATFRRAVERLRVAGVEGLHLIEGPALLGVDGEDTVDGVHPNDLGFLRMAEAIAPTLCRIL